MNIAFLSTFSPTNNIGGVENHIRFISSEFGKMGHSVTIFVPTHVIESNTQDLIHENVQIIHINIKYAKIVRLLENHMDLPKIGFLFSFLKKLSFNLSAKQISSHIKKSKIDILHQHDFTSSMGASKLAARHGIPCILTNHTGEYLYFQKSWFGRFLLRHLLSHYKFIIGPSTELTPRLPDINSVTIYNGVSPDLFYKWEKRRISASRQNFGFTDQDFLILCPRRWAPTKGVIFLIKSIIENKYPSHFKFLFAGSDYNGFPAYVHEIENLISNAPNPSQIVKLGNCDITQMATLYNLSNISIIPSLMEAVSLSAVESMATGTPVISTNVGGMPELIHDNINGLLIPPGDPVQIYKSIMKIYQLPSGEVDSMTNEGHKTAKNLSWQAIACATLQIYRETLNKEQSS
ncbi:glycosyltransferase family 4 protein [Thalassospira mesophila]|uniref:glycosyltransferase family 4 protein n=1 Tax=Thalassospira mesophila TaxID=1293891 RepID=UPI000A1D7AEA|nr:glycosyltransferase family 4 protein [Thalassospira mesophila]